MLTHLHIDHDGGLAAFPASEILVSPRRARRAAGIAGRLRGYLPERWPKDFDPKPLVLDGGPYGPFQRSKRLTADGAVVAVATPGHTPDHLSVIVEDGDAVLFIAGDASYSEATMLSGAIDGVSEEEAKASATLAAIRALAEARPTIYLPAHDPDARAKARGARHDKRRREASPTCAPLSIAGYRVTPGYGRPYSTVAQRRVSAAVMPASEIRPKALTMRLALRVTDADRCGSSLRAEGCLARDRSDRAQCRVQFGDGR